MPVVEVVVRTTQNREVVALEELVVVAMAGKVRQARMEQQIQVEAAEAAV